MFAVVIRFMIADQLVVIALFPFACGAFGSAFVGLRFAASASPASAASAPTPARTTFFALFSFGRRFAFIKLALACFRFFLIQPFAEKLIVDVQPIFERLVSFFTA